MLPQPTSPGDVVQAGSAMSATTGPVETDPEIERMAVSQLSAAAREALPAVRRPGAPTAGGRPASASQPAADATGRAGVNNRSVSVPGPPPPLALPPVRPPLRAP